MRLCENEIDRRLRERERRKCARQERRKRKRKKMRHCTALAHTSIERKSEGGCSSPAFPRPLAPSARFLEPPPFLARTGLKNALSQELPHFALGQNDRTSLTEVAENKKGVDGADETTAGNVWWRRWRHRRQPEHQRQGPALPRRERQPWPARRHLPSRSSRSRRRRRRWKRLAPQAPPQPQQPQQPDLARPRRPRRRGRRGALRLDERERRQDLLHPQRAGFQPALDQEEADVLDVVRLRHPRAQDLDGQFYFAFWKVDFLSLSLFIFFSPSRFLRLSFPKPRFLRFSRTRTASNTTSP